MSLFYIEREAWSIGCPLVCWPLHMHYDASVLMLLSAGELYSSFASSLWVALESVTQQRQYPLAHLNWYSWSTGYSYEYTKLTGRVGKENVWELLVWPSPQPITTHVWWCVYMHTPPGLPVSRAGVRRWKHSRPTWSNSISQPCKHTQERAIHNYKWSNKPQTWWSLLHAWSLCELDVCTRLVL